MIMIMMIPMIMSTLSLVAYVDKLTILLVDTSTIFDFIASSLQIMIADVNDNCPILPDVSYSRYPIPPLQVGAVFTISATDNDSGDNGKISYQSSDIIASM